MGCWSPENIANDGILDVRAEQSEALLQRIVTLANSQKAAEFDEPEYDWLFYNFEALFALEAHDLFVWHRCPTPEAARELQAQYLSAWSAYYPKSRASEEFTAQRRQFIEQTFERFVAGCVRQYAPPA